MVENAEPMTTEEPQVKETKTEADVDGLMAELEKAGVTNTDELSGKLRASHEAGRSAQLLGDERKRNAELEQRLKKLESKPQQQDFMDYPEGQPVDIEAAIERSVSSTLDKRDQAAREAQQRNLENWNRIQSDEDYGLIKEIWEEKLKDPGFVMQIQSGAKDPVSEYQTTLRNFYKTLLKKSHETITTMRGGKPPPPHVETGERSSANVVSETPSGTEADRKIAEMKEKTDKGHVMSTEEELGMIDNIFGTKAPL